MTWPRTRLLAVGAVSAALAASYIASLSTGSDSGGPLAPAPAAASGALTPFDDCADVRDWYVEHALPRVTAWGLDQGIYSDLIPQRDTSRTSKAESVGSSETGTNVQEAGVDEADIAKTDGDAVVTLRGDSLVVTDVSGTVPVEIGRVEVKKQGELLLVGDHAVVTSSAATYSPFIDTIRYVGPRYSTITAVDLSDPSNPTVDDVRRIDGNLLAAREHDGTVRIALSSAPALNFVHPTRKRTAAQARAKNREIVRASTVDDWLPQSRVDGNREPLVDCAQISHPERGAGIGTITVLTMDPDDPADVAATAVSADGSQVYASADRFYIATTAGGWGWIRRGRGHSPSTDIHAFATDSSTTEYVASGSVPGYVPDRWAFSEDDGVLRVAAEQGNGPGPTETVVSALEEHGSTLKVVGSVGGIGIGEQIKAVRWFGDLGVVVTFRQTDPLYTLDLSDPTQPRILGELKIRGYSSYLHPIGGDLLLGIGQRATMRGRERGLQVSVFDLADPTRIAKLSFGRRWSFTPIEYDARAFTYLPEQRLMFVPVAGDGQGVRVEVVRVDKSGALNTHTTVKMRGWSETIRTLPIDDDRVAVVAGGRVQQILDV